MEPDEVKVCRDEGKSERWRRDPGETLMSDSHLGGSMFLDTGLDSSRSANEEEDVADGLTLFGGTNDGRKRRRGGSVVETLPVSVPAMKIHFHRLWKDNQENVTRASCDGRADDDDPASKCCGGTAAMSSAASMPIFQTLPREVLESICNLLPALDVCRLCQVCQYMTEFLSDDEIWERRAQQSNHPNAHNGLSWRQIVCLSESRRLCIRPLDSKPVRLTGDFTFIDPYKLFFLSRESAPRLAELKGQVHDLHAQHHRELLVMYRGQTAYFITSDYWYLETAFEISRNGVSLGFDEAPSRLIAVVPRKLVDLLVHENGEDAKLPGGVSVEGVDGQLIFSGDGDFIVSGSEKPNRHRRISRWIEDDCVWKADVLCAAGGRWTFCDDTTDEDEGGEELGAFLYDDCEWDM